MEYKLNNKVFINNQKQQIDIDPSVLVAVLAILGKRKGSISANELIREAGQRYLEKILAMKTN